MRNIEIAGMKAEAHHLETIKEYVEHIKTRVRQSKCGRERLINEYDSEEKQDVHTYFK